MTEDTSVETTAGAQDTTLTKDEVTSVDNWRDTLPQDIKTNKVIQETPDITTMAKRVIDQDNFITKSIRIPDDGDTSGMDELYNKLGRPETVAGYKVTRPDVLEGQKYNEEIEKSFLDIAHKTGLNTSQVNTLMKWNQEQASSQMAGEQTNNAEAMGKLKEEWGTAFDQNVKIAEEVLNQYGNDATEALIKDNAGLISLMYNMGKNLVEGTIEGKAMTSHIRTPQEAQIEIDKLKRDDNFKKAYYDKRDPTHNAAVEQMRLLMVEAHPEPEAVVY